MPGCFHRAPTPSLPSASSILSEFLNVDLLPNMQASTNRRTKCMCIGKNQMNITSTHHLLRIHVESFQRVPSSAHSIINLGCSIPSCRALVGVEAASLEGYSVGQV